MTWELAHAYPPKPIFDAFHSHTSVSPPFLEVSLGAYISLLLTLPLPLRERVCKK